MMPNDQAETRAYDDYALSMGREPGKIVPPADSVRQLVLSGAMKTMLEAGNARTGVELDNAALMHVLNILIPQVRDEAFKTQLAA